MATIRPSVVRRASARKPAPQASLTTRPHAGFALLGIVALLGLVALMPGTGWVGPPAAGGKGDKGVAEKGSLTKLDVVFVVDTTGSMEPTLTNLARNIGSFTKTLGEGKVDFQIGVVTFKDRVNDPEATREPKSLKFGDKETTSDVEALQRELSKLTADGGGDAPESGFDALDFASRREFRVGARRVLVLVTDDSPRAPDKDVKDENELAKLLKDRGIAQLHMMLDFNPERYDNLHKVFGSPTSHVVRLPGLDFAKTLEAFARASSGELPAVAAGEPMPSKAVDVVFVVDATGSMEAHIKNLRESAAKLAAELEVRKLDARFAATVYRDRVDDVGNKPEDPFALKFDGMEFTKNIGDITKALAEVKADGGGDFPESAYDALDFSSKLPFRKEARRIFVLVTDAPPRVPDKDIKDEAQLAKVLLERNVYQLHILHDLEPERFAKLQKALGKVGRLTPLFPGGLEKMQQSMVEIGRDIAGPDPALVKVPPASGTGKVDVVFVVDTTGSMGPDLGTLKEKFGLFAKVLQESKADFQLGVVTFKDRVDDPADTRDPKSLMFDGKELTGDAEAVAKAIGGLPADGGGDEPESGFDALDFASKRTFRPGARKVLVLVTDAPPRVPDKDIKDEDQLAPLLKERGIDQYHLIARGTLDRYARLASLHGKGRVVNLAKGDDFGAGMADIGKDVVAGIKDGGVAGATTTKVDVVVLLDATGSMGDQINGVRDNLKRLLTNLEAKKLDVRIGVTVFRDGVDMVANTPEDPFALKVGGEEFTKDIDGLIKEIEDKAKAKDGGDTPESGFDGLVFASQRGFRPDAARVLLLITDAPPRSPDKKAKDERETAEALAKNGIHQLHLIVRENPKLYEEVQRLIEKGGRSVGLKFNLDEGLGFAKMFDAISDGVVARLGPIEPPPVVASSNKLDIFFVVDTTGSMDLGPWRDNLREFHKVLKDAKIDFQIGIIGFKDRVEDPAETREPKLHMFDGKELTSDIEALGREAGTMTSGGGGDDPESGLDALDFATKRAMRPDARKVFIMFTDAPPRIPDKDIKDEDQMARLFKERGIEQFHLIGRNAVERYERLVKLTGKGKIVRPDKGDDFKAGMIDIAKDASTGIFLVSNKIDLVFVVDTTGSMDAHLRNLRENVGKFTEALKAAKSDFQVGVVTYTDRVEDAPPGNEHKVLKFAGDREFTTDPDELVKELAKLSAFGGGDAPESGFDALEFASRRPFRKDARKIFVLITDEGPRVPDKEMKDEDHVAKFLNERKIETLHIMHGANQERYVKLSKMLPREGKIIDLGKVGGGDAFKNSLVEIAAASATGGSIGGDRKLPIAGTRVDLVFVVDTTGSMGDFNGNTMAPAERIIKKLQEEKVDVRITLIDFKDRHAVDGNVAVDHKIVLLNGKEFSGSLEDLRAGVNSLRADGGGDAPESSHDALAFAAKREFRLDALKVLILITDEGPKVPDKEMRDENDVLRIFKERGIHQLHLIVGNSPERYNTIQRMLGKDGKPAGKSTRIGDRGSDGFNRDVDQMTLAILDQLRTDARVKLSDRPLPPLALEKNPKGQGMVDVVFVVDATASMGPDIALVKDGAAKMAKKMQELNIDARFGVSFYRDRVDKVDNTPEDPKALLFNGDEFTTDMAEFAKQVGMLKAMGGGDVDESALDGLEFASRRPFRKGAHKVLILVTDGPPRIPDKEMKDEFELGELLRERGIHQLHLLLKTEGHRYVTVQRFLTGDGTPSGTQHDLATIGRTERNIERLMDALSRSIAADNRRGLDKMAKGK